MGSSGCFNFITGLRARMAFLVPLAERLFAPARLFGATFVAFLAGVIFFFAFVVAAFLVEALALGVVRVFLAALPAAFLVVAFLAG
ncbi:MAG: hypothetical protein COU68_03845 [Candidatus Pacebacteria bacterium CG10_big_fil_rev_8_21_14_0_10_45_6]|nr:MAG: hypothetical protein COU68_03845 [Candidatus Pacebacteria bacterium CG10_big_fil_rev_8_21_14_0_10_45_6]